MAQGIEHFDPTDCVLCDFTAKTPEEYNEHMEEFHD